MLTVITPYKGKLTILAKGVRRITSRRGGNVELLNKVKLHIFQGKGMPILTEAEGVETFPRIKSDLVLSSYGSHLAELANRLLPENQPIPQAYNLLVVALTLLERNPRQIFIRAFEVKLLTVLGFWSLSEVDFGDIGGVRKILEQLQVKGWEEIEKLAVTEEEALEVERILRYYMEKVLEGKLKSLEMIKKLKNERS